MSQEPVNPSSELSSPEQSPEPKKLSPVEEADLQAKRLSFRQLHDLVAECEVYDAEAALGMVSGAVQSAYNSYWSKVKVSDLEITCDDAKQSELLTHLKDLSVEQAVKFLEVLNNAISLRLTAKIVKQDVKVKELDIELL